MEETQCELNPSSSTVKVEEDEPPDPSTLENDPEKPPSIELTTLVDIAGARETDLFGDFLSPSTSSEQRLEPQLVHAARNTFRKRYFPGVTQQQWNDWRWQLKNRITSIEDISRIIRLSPIEQEAFSRGEGNLPFAITPYYASLIDPDNPIGALRRTMVPDIRETILSDGEAADPLGEDASSPVPGLIHRYPDRVLFLVTNHCSSYCRYCTRTRIMHDHSQPHCSIHDWRAAIQYIASHPEVRDVIVSGGDPLTLEDDKIDWLLGSLRKIPHVEIIRIGTKVPMVLPQRITARLMRILSKYHPLWMSIHCTHPDELTPESKKACSMLANTGIPLGSQTVLLAGVNDDPDVMKRLMQGLLRFRIRPYYLYQCDPITGSAHFRTSVEAGLRIIRALRGHTSGYAVPTYVIDAPGGGGKIPLLPQYAQGYEGQDLILKNYQGRLFRYHDDADTVENPVALPQIGDRLIEPVPSQSAGR